MSDNQKDYAEKYRIQCNQYKKDKATILHQSNQYCIVTQHWSWYSILYSIVEMTVVVRNELTLLHLGISTVSEISRYWKTAASATTKTVKKLKVLPQLHWNVFMPGSINRGLWLLVHTIHTEASSLLRPRFTLRLRKTQTQRMHSALQLFWNGYAPHEHVCAY